MTQKATESLVVDNLNVSIEGQPILKNINVFFPVNKITCIVGPSGCGKSTLLRCLNRLTENIDGFTIKGSVLIDGQDIVTADDEHLIELRRHVGLVPQRPCPLPMSIYDNVAYGCRIHGMHTRKHEMDETVERYLTEVGLWDEVKDRLRRPATRLSIGQQQRLCLARSLAVEPDFILADEATSALDPISSKTIEELFVRLKEKYTIIMVTHTLPQALRIADYAVFLYLGEIVEEGDASQVFRSPKNELTKRYLSGLFS
ncbi:MAG: phosphate ABC transporter ATP-binding protein [Bacteroidaceae bacterium]|nr:phosphate ABC transporter ATP-binding protein [Bacteroidaceae bacterium]MBP5646423.1 phosphate ABC transporter ATP-binding protein [Bacteroidaceae bacterium]